MSALSELEPTTYPSEAGVALIVAGGVLIMALFIITGQPFLLTLATAVVTVSFAACALLLSTTIDDNIALNEIPVATKEDQG